MVDRTGKKPAANPIYWVGFFLKLIGRLTYKFIFLVFKLIGSMLQSIGFILIKFFKWVFSLKLPKFQFPKFKLPQPKFPKIKKPKIKPMKFKLPKFHWPKLSFKFPRFKIKRPKKKFKLKPPKHWRLILLISFILIFLATFFYVYIIRDLPSPQTLITRKQALTTKIYDRNGQLLYKIYKNENRSLINLNELPDHFIKATLAAEDSQFYQHNGFSWTGIFRSLKKFLTEGRVQGGSTITQQLVKNALLTHEKTIKRKTKELILSMLVELNFSKDEILQMYFNEIPYGGLAYGAEEAAQIYFNKSIRNINLTEAALLAGLPAAPTQYSPFGAHPELAQARQHFVLDRMVEEQFITPQQAQEAKQENLELQPYHNGIQAPHFVMYIKELLADKYGTLQVEQGGLQVTTSLDLNLQKQLENIVEQELDKISHLNVNNGAALITNPQTGEILAMVGSKDYYDMTNDGNVNVTLRPRQPGSSIKPINYAVALENGYTPATIIYDTPITYNYAGSPPYSPQNYDGRFHGPVTLRRALACSYNVPAVKVLNSYGVAKMLEKGQEMGITTWNQPERYGLALTLGGAEVKMVDMAVAYGSLANLGVRVDLHPILEVTDSQGKILEKRPMSLNNQKVLSSATSYLLTDILSDNNARSPAFGYNSDLNIPGHQVAVKTGTTNNMRDNWTIGYTQDYLVAVWVGNNDNTPMSRVASGITGASPIWHQTMSLLLENQSSHNFIKPTDLLEVEICSYNGLLPCAGCPTKKEYFIPGTEPRFHCDPEKMKKDEEEKTKTEAQRNKILEGLSDQR